MTDRFVHSEVIENLVKTHKLPAGAAERIARVAWETDQCTYRHIAIPGSIQVDRVGVQPDTFTITRNYPKAEIETAGCWIDGHWGQYGVARMVQIAAEYGFGEYGYEDVETLRIANKKMSAMMPSDSESPTDEEEEYLSDSADEVENWLNANVAAEGHEFGWHDGEFFYQSNEWFAED